MNYNKAMKTILLVAVTSFVAFYLGISQSKVFDEMKNVTEKRSKFKVLSDRGGSVDDSRKDVFSVGNLEDNLVKKMPLNFANLNEEEFGIFLSNLMQVSYDDPENGLALVRKYEESGSSEKLDVVYGLYGVALAKKNAASALEWGKSIKNTEIQSSTLKAIFSEILKNDPVSTLREIEGYMDRGWAAPIVSLCLQSMAKRSPSEAVDWISNNLRNNPSMYYSSMSSVFASIGSSDPDALIDILNKNDFGRDNSILLKNSIYGMASLNFDSACDFIKRADLDKVTQKEMLLGLCESGLFAAHHDAITAMVFDAAPDSVVKILTPAVSEWIQNDIKPALSWLDTQNVEFQRAFFTSGGIASIAALNPRLAIEKVDSLGLSGVDETNSLGSVVAVWGFASPGDSLGWLETREADLQNKLIGKWCEAMKGIDQDVALRFLDSAPRINRKALELARTKLTENH